MPQSLTQQQIQEQKLIQQQRITQQQLLTARLIGMSLPELEQNVKAEIDDNPALEGSFEESENEEFSAAEDGSQDEVNEDFQESDDFQDELNSALENMGSDDEVVEDDSFYSQGGAGQSDRIFGETQSFYDKIEEQVGELSLDDRERSIVEYLVGSLDDDGFLRKDLASIVDELAIFEYIDTTQKEVERLLRQVQSFDPAGIGARNLQECLRLQVERKEEGRLKDCMLEVINHHFEAFMKGRWDKIKTSLRLTDSGRDTLRQEFRRLNPKPGAAFSESFGRSNQQITPDFIVSTTDDGKVAFEINTGHVPHLSISEDFASMMENYKKAEAEKPLKKADKDVFVYVKRNVERAESFIGAIKQRQKSMSLTMGAIIAHQKKFFLSGDESDLRPMILKDIATETGLDISTVSRVSNEKYAQTLWGIFPLKYFFSEGFATKEGEELSSRAIRQALKELIEKEDKRRPYTDEALVEEMKKRGFPLARRTVAKYREKLGIATSHLRKTHK